MPSPSQKAQKPAPKKPLPPPSAQAALTAVEAELSALPADSLLTINLDIPQTVSLILGVLPGLVGLRDAAQKQLPEHPMQAWDRLDTYALALWGAHLLLQPDGGENTKTLIEEGTVLRESLLSDATALSRRGLLDGAVLDEIRAGSGHIDMASDLVALSALFAQAYPDIEHKTAATKQEIQRAGELGPLILAAVALRNQDKPAGLNASDRRKRAYTLLVNAYDQVRRAVFYLRWNEGDADLYVPSLWRKGRNGGRPSQNDASESSAEEDIGAKKLPGAQDTTGSDG